MISGFPISDSAEEIARPLPAPLKQENDFPILILLSFTVSSPPQLIPRIQSLKNGSRGSRVFSGWLPHNKRRDPAVRGSINFMPLISFTALRKVTSDSLPAGNGINLLFSKISIPILSDKALTKVRPRRNAYCVKNIGSLPLGTLDLWWVLCPATRPCDLVRDDGVRMKRIVGIPASDISGNVRSVEVRKCALVTPRGGALLTMYAELFPKVVQRLDEDRYCRK